MPAGPRLEQLRMQLDNVVEAIDNLGDETDNPTLNDTRRNRLKTAANKLRNALGDVDQART